MNHAEVFACKKDSLIVRESKGVERKVDEAENQ